MDPSRYRLTPFLARHRKPDAMIDHSGLTPGHRACALSLAAVVGVMVDVFLWQLRPALANWQSGLGFTLPPFGFFTLCIVVGSFVAIPLCLATGMPLWHLAERAGRRRRRDALGFGVLTGAVVGALMLATSLSREYAVGGIDRDALLDFLDYCAAGACAGLVAHRAAFSRE